MPNHVVRVCELEVHFQPLLCYYSQLQYHVEHQTVFSHYGLKGKNSITTCKSVELTLSIEQIRA